MAQTKRKRKSKPVADAIMLPTEEQLAQGTFARNTIAYRRVPVIDTLRQEHKLTQRQFDGLTRYRDAAIAEDSSPIEDSVGKMMRGACGGGAGLSPKAVRAALELGRLERALGSLRNIARAIAVDDHTISQWAMSQFGSLECERKGVISFEPSKLAFSRAWLDLRAAGDRLAADVWAHEK